ncbi:MAG TPA: hypothetical protein VLJ39_20195 [Tepidisphaeraceae bacterium]|nr:hypothetical protein [Tepidisphaeraceae bacterium]
MALDANLRGQLEQALATVDEHGTTGPRLVDDAVRLWRRIGRFIAMNLVAAEGLDLEALELSCYAIQLPLRRPRTLPSGRPARATVRERAEEAAELLMNVAPDADEGLLDRTTRLLQEMPHRSPMLEEARLLADALNLDDFGVTGLVQQTLQLARQGDGLLQLADGMEKREQYGYWDARLKDGFHFEPVRQIARRRLDNARHLALLLLTELREDA